MELGDLFDDELKTGGAWLPLGPAPEWLLGARLLEKRAGELDEGDAANALRAHARAIHEKLGTGARVRVRFLPHDRRAAIEKHPAATRRVSLVLAAVTGWEGMTAGGRELAFNAATLERVALSNDAFIEFVERTSRNLALLTAWRDREVKKN